MIIHKITLDSFINFEASVISLINKLLVLIFTFFLFYLNLRIISAKKGLKQQLLMYQTITSYMGLNCKYDTKGHFARGVNNGN